MSSVLPRGARVRLSTPALIDVAIATLAVLLIASPLLFTSDGFAPDFTNAIWLADYQQHVIAAHLHPTLFLQTQQGGVFYPIFAFYGGTLFALTGALAVVLGGSTILAFEVVTLAAIAAAYGGLFWLARQLGVKGLLAHAPAIVFVTSAYYVTNLYGRGAWEEFIAVSMLPLVLAASLRLVRGRLSVGPVACLVAASAVFSGSHNITLLWGSTLAVAGARCVLAAERAFARAAVAADARRRRTDRARRRPERLVFAPRHQLRTRHDRQRPRHRVERDGVLQHLRGDLRPVANGAKRIRDSGTLRSGSCAGARLGPPRGAALLALSAFAGRRGNGADRACRRARADHVLGCVVVASNPLSAGPVRLPPADLRDAGLRGAGPGGRAGAHSPGPERPRHTLRPPSRARVGARCRVQPGALRVAAVGSEHAPKRTPLLVLCEPRRRLERRADAPTSIVVRGERLPRSQSCGPRHDGPVHVRPAFRTIGSPARSCFPRASSLLPRTSPVVPTWSMSAEACASSGGPKKATSCSNARRTDPSPSLSN